MEKTLGYVTLEKGKPPRFKAARNWVPFFVVGGAALIFATGVLIAMWVSL